MARGDYETNLVLRTFGGLDQSKEPESISYYDSPDAINMDTSYGGLATAKGFKHLDLPEIQGGIKSLGKFYNRQLDKSWIIAANNDAIYAYENHTGGLWLDNEEAKTSGTEWTEIGSAQEGFAGFGDEIDFLNYQYKDYDILLMADGKNEIFAWSGVGKIDYAVVTPPETGLVMKLRHIELNYERVWGAGIPGHEDTLYWSRQYNYRNWLPDADDPDEGGGYVEIPTWDGGEIRMIKQLFNDIIVFKDYNMYKVSGSYPGEYYVAKVTGVEGPIAARTVVEYGNTVYFLSKHGLCQYDGIQCKDTLDWRWRKWFERLNDNYATKACSIIFGHMMYIAMPIYDSETNNLIIEYNFRTNTVMARTGINVNHWLEFEDHLLFSNDSGMIYEYGVGDTYDGEPIDAYWKTGNLNMGSSSNTGDRTTKQLGELTCYGSGRCHITTTADHKTKQCEIFMKDWRKRTRKRLNVRGRRFQITFASVDGIPFRMQGNVTINMDIESD